MKEYTYQADCSPCFPFGVDALSALSASALISLALSLTGSVSGSVPELRPEAVGLAEDSTDRSTVAREEQAENSTNSKTTEGSLAAGLIKAGTTPASSLPHVRAEFQWLRCGSPVYLGLSNGRSVDVLLVLVAERLHPTRQAAKETNIASFVTLRRRPVSILTGRLPYGQYRITF